MHICTHFSVTVIRYISNAYISITDAKVIILNYLRKNVAYYNISAPN